MTYPQTRCKSTDIRANCNSSTRRRHTMLRVRTCPQAQHVSAPNKSASIYTTSDIATIYYKPELQQQSQMIRDVDV